MKRVTESRGESIIAALLQSGVLLAAAVVIAGAVLYLFRYGLSLPHYRVFAGEPNDLRSIRGIISDVASFRSRGIIQLGLLLLIATPVTRVAFSILMFIEERDRLYTFITIFVLCLLIFSLTGGIGS